LPWICLAGTLVLFVLYLASLHPANWFGRGGDDAFFFSSAKALAEGRGYIIPSLPGNPPQTKYPVLYPWLLSAVWKWNPSFPANLALGVSLTVLFSCWFLIAAFALLRKLKGVGDWSALAMIAVCAFDLPFMALAATAALVADDAMRTDGPWSAAGLAGVLAGLSLMMRSIGVAVIAGILVAALFRRAFRQAAAFCIGAAPFVAGFLVTLRPSRAVGGSNPAGAIALPGWQQTLLYDTSYLRMWRLCVPNLHVFAAMLRGNLEQFILAPAVYVLSPTLDVGHGWGVNAVGAFVGVFSLLGLLRQAREQEWKPIHFIFVFYLAIVLVWNYPIMYRFLLLFLPFFLAGLWIEGQRIASLINAKLRQTSPASERVLAGTVAAGVAALSCVAAWNCVSGYRPQLRTISTQHAAVTQQALPVYAWVRERTAPGAVIVAMDDVNLYLYTGRRSVVPIAFSTEYLYTADLSALEHDVDHLTDTAVALDACYWFVTPNDFEMFDFPTSAPQERLAQLTSGLPEVSHSEDGRTRLYDASSLSHQQSGACAANPPSHEQGAN
jgi:hypothetical protein